MTEDVHYDACCDENWSYEMAYKKLKKHINGNNTTKLLKYIGNDVDNRRALEYAVKKNNLYISKFLIKMSEGKCYRLTCQNYYYIVALAVKNRNYVLIDLLIETGEKYDHPENDKANSDYISGNRNYDPLYNSIKLANKMKDMKLKLYLSNKNCDFSKKVNIQTRKKRNDDANYFRNTDPKTNSALSHAIDKGDIHMLKKVFNGYKRSDRCDLKKEALNHIHYNTLGFNCIDILEYLKNIK